MIDRLMESFREMADWIAAAAPKVVLGIVLVLAALVVAKLIEWITRAILTRLKFDSLVARVGIDKTLQRAGIRQQLNQLLPRLVYFLLLFLFARTAADALGLAAISDAIGSFFGYLPNLIAAVLLVVIGSAVGQFAGRTVAQAAEESGIEFGPALGRAVTAVIMLIVGLMAIAQLKIDTEILRIVTSLSLAGFALAFGLCFGLGARDVTRNILAGFYARRILQVGEEVELGGQRGVLRAITSTHTLIESEGRTVSLANQRFLDEVSRQ